MLVCPPQHSCRREREDTVTIAPFQWVIDPASVRSSGLNPLRRPNDPFHHAPPLRADRRHRSRRLLGQACPMIAARLDHSLTSGCQSSSPKQPRGVLRARQAQQSHLDPTRQGGLAADGQISTDGGGRLQAYGLARCRQRGQPGDVSYDSLMIGVQLTPRPESSPLGSMGAQAFCADRESRLAHCCSCSHVREPPTQTAARRSLPPRRDYSGLVGRRCGL